MKSNPSLIESYRKDLGTDPKFDLVYPEEFKSYLEETSLTGYNTSAKTGENVENAFSQIGRKILEQIL